MAKLPKYAEMSIEQLNEHCAKWHQVIVSSRKAIREARRTGEWEAQFALEMKVGEANAHLNIIQPLRTIHFSREEFERSQQAASIRGRISEETYRQMLQDIGLPHVPATTTVNDGTVTEG